MIGYSILNKLVIRLDIEYKLLARLKIKNIG
jgi:hypothetical protein